jgi:WD40 repeat protein
MIDGQPVIASGGEDRTIRLWDARTSEPIGAPLEGHIDHVTSAAFGMIDGRPVIASGSRDRTIRLWDARTGETIGAPPNRHTRQVSSVALGAIDGRPVVVSGSEDNTIRLSDAHAGESGRCLAITVGEPVRGLDADGGAKIVVGVSRGILLLEVLSMPRD